MKVTLPLFVLLPRKTKADKRISLNLNVYRNLNFIVNNQAKQIFKQAVATQLKDVKLNAPIEIIYTLYPKTKRSLDIANILCIVDKFFCDALVECGCIEDDNYHFLPKVSYRFGGIDKDNPRAEAVIEEID